MNWRDIFKSILCCQTRTRQVTRPIWQVTCLVVTRLVVILTLVSFNWCVNRFTFTFTFEVTAMFVTCMSNNVREESFVINRRCRHLMRHFFTFEFIFSELLIVQKILGYWCWTNIQNNWTAAIWRVWKGKEIRRNCELVLERERISLSKL